jgi:hypothetical protein
MHRRDAESIEAPMPEMSGCCGFRDKARSPGRVIRMRFRSSEVGPARREGLSQDTLRESDRATTTVQARLGMARTLHVCVAQRQEVRTSCAFGTWTYNAQATRTLWRGATVPPMRTHRIEH